MLAACVSDGDPPQAEADVAGQSSALVSAPFCYGASGGQPMAPSPMVGLCPAHRNQSPAVGAQSASKPSGWPNGVAMGAAVRGSPVISSSGMIVSGSTARIVTVNANGGVRWPLTPGLAAGSSPAIGADGYIYMVTNEGSPKVRKLNPTDASNPWSVTINGTSSAGPALSADGATLYVTTQPGRLYALNTSTGATRWWKPTGAIWTSPAVGADGTIYVGADDGLYAFLPDGTKAWGPTSFGTGALVRASPAIAVDGTIYVGTDLATLEAVNPDGSKLWTYTTTGMSIVRSSPAIANDGTIYFGTRDHNLYAVNPNGTLRWTFPTAGNVDSSPAIGADGTIYVGSDDFKLYAVRPDGTELFSVATGNFVRGGVAIGRNGTVYVGSDDQKLWAFGPGTCGSTDTTCNGADENCNGNLDEGYVGSATSCGIGACASAGASSCVNGAVQDSCVPGTPAADTSCNGIDENCDGIADDGFVSSSTTCGIGACARTGTTSCVNGSQQNSCVPGTPGLSGDTTCDARDDDCNGVVDDGCGSSSGPSVAAAVKLTPESISADGSTWADANGSGIVFTAGGGSNAPVLGADLRGRRGLYFNGWQFMQGSLGDTTSWSGVTITAVFATFGVPPLAAVFGSGGAVGAPNTTAGVRWVMGAGLDPARGLGWAGADGTTHLGGGGYEPSTYYVMTWKRGRTGSGWTIRRNGQVLTSAPIADSSFPTGVFNAFLGAEKVPDGSHYGGNMTLHELHVYPQELSDADTAALERGLADAYDIGWYADGATATPDVVLGSDLVAWYDAFDLSGADGAPVASWPNQTGNAALASSGAAQPLRATSGIHGHPSVVADGVDDFMLAPLDPPMPVGSRPHVWAVVRNVTPLPARTYVAVYGDSQGVRIGTDNGDPYPNWLVVTNGASGLITPTMASAADKVPHIVSAAMSANSLEHGLKVDGISGVGALGDPGAISAPISQVRLFSASNGGFANIHIGEVIVSRTTPTPEMDRAIHRYLAAKWRKAAPVCGDGTVDPGEQCDDTNIAGGDGCSASCALEQACWSCQSGDGCCPANLGCTGVNDSDCEAGNPCANAQSCVGGDGCCPIDCERSGDGDCPPLPPPGCSATSECYSGFECDEDIGWCVLDVCATEEASLRNCDTCDCPVFCEGDCTGKTCGSDGCGGVCNRPCTLREPCESDEDCGEGEACGVDNGDNFGLAFARVCWPLKCHDLDPGEIPCGTPEDPCGTCDTCNATANCAGRQCGSNGCGGTCGAPGPNEFCDGSYQMASRRYTGRGPGGVYKIRGIGFPIGFNEDDLATQSVGTLNGTAEVTSDGQATYRIPIEAPPGRGGLAPSLELSYRSGAPATFLGEGWSLTGLPSITRCPKTMALDNAAGPVEFSDDDRYCLNGQRLVAVEDGAYGTDETQYRTETETFAKIVSHGESGRGPEWFEVFTKDGRIQSFGDGENSKIRASENGPIQTWALGTVRDRSGNSMRVTYEVLARKLAESSIGEETPPEDDCPGCWQSREFYPISIAYSGHEASGLSADRFVELAYDHRDTMTANTAQAWRWGVLIQNTVVLRTITTSLDGLASEGGFPVRQYSLNYRTADNGRLLLETATECAPRTRFDASLMCKPLTVFTYSQDVGGLQSPQDLGEYVHAETQNYPVPVRTDQSVRTDLNLIAGTTDIVADFDGNGVDDILFQDFDDHGNIRDAVHRRWMILRDGRNLQPTGALVVESEASGDSIKEPAEPTVTRFISYSVVDWNLDGADDLVGFFGNGPANVLQVLTFNRATSSFEQQSTNIPATQANIAAVDANGDGRGDLLTCERLAGNNGPGIWRLYMHRYGGTRVFNVDSNSRCFPTAGARAIDIDGDGGQEVLRQDPKVPSKKTVMKFFPPEDPSGKIDTAWYDVLSSAAPATNPSLKEFTLDLPSDAIPLDANADGLVDFVALLSDGVLEPSTALQVFINTGSAIPFQGSCLIDGSGWPADHQPACSSTLCMCSWFQRSPLLQYPSGVSLLRAATAVLDYDGDGNDDILIPTCDEIQTFQGDRSGDRYAETCKRDGSEIWKVLRSTGDGRFELTDLEPDGPGSTLPLRDELLFTQRAKSMDANGDGVKDFVLLESKQRQTYQALLRRGPRTHLLKRVEDGLRHFDEFDYLPLTSSEVYAPGSFIESDSCDMVGCAQPRHPVVAVQREGGLHGVSTRTTKFNYSGARNGFQGRGWLGFGLTVRTETTSAAEPSVHAEYYGNAYWQNENRSYPFAGRAWKVLDAVVSTTDEGTTSYTREVLNDLRWRATSNRDPDAPGHSGGGFVYTGNSSDAQREGPTTGGGTLVGISTATFTIDDFGNLKHREISRGNTTTTETTDIIYKHENDQVSRDNWLIALPESVTTTSTGYLSSATRTQSYGYEDNGLPRTITFEPGSGEDEQITTFMRDGFGNVTAISWTGADESEARTREYEYGDDGRSVTPTAVIDNQYRVEVEFDPGRGDLLAKRDEARPGAAPLTSYWGRDGFGRTLIAIQPNGRSVTTRYLYDAPFRIEVEEQLGAHTRTEYDSLGREVRRVERDPFGKELERITTYDGLWRRWHVTRSHDAADDGSDQESTFTYDRRGRLVRSELPNGDATEFCYAPGVGGGAGSISCARDAKGFINCSAQDTTGRIVQTFEASSLGRTFGSANCSTVANTLATAALPAPDTQRMYGPFDSRLALYNAAGYVTVTHADAYGHLTALFDPDLGDRTYEYNAFGELTGVVDELNTTVYDRDAFGRVKSRTELEGTGPNVVGTTSFEWDACVTGCKTIGLMGNLRRAVGSDGKAVDFEYTAKGQLRSIIREIEGQSDLVMTIDRDAVGRPEVINYPSTTGPFRVHNTFSGFGQLTAVTNLDTGEPLWGLDSTNAFGQIHEETLGGDRSVEHLYEDQTGRISDLIYPGRTIHYGYDPNGNVDQRADLGLEQTFVYDEMNRLKSITSSGFTQSYDYDELGLGNLISKSGFADLYKYEDPRPHAPSSAERGALSETYYYDDNGNLRDRVGDLRPPLHIEYNAQSKPTLVYSSNPQTDGTRFTYDPFDVRSSKVGPTSSTIYFDGYYYRTQSSTGVSENFLITDGARLLGQVVRDAAGQRFVSFEHDNLGSIVGSSSTGTPPQRMQFSPFGEPMPGGGAPATSLGFTAHEADSELGLVNMRGRMYDPARGQFMSADPLLTRESNLGQNRYAYVLNNPLRFRDPSGFAPEGPAGSSGDTGSGQVRLIGGSGSWPLSPVPYPELSWPLSPVPDPELSVPGSTTDFNTPEPSQSMECLDVFCLLADPGVQAGLRPLLIDSLWGSMILMIGFIPAVGEPLDLQILLSQHSTDFERTAAAISLTLNIVTAGIAPNFGAVVRDADELTDAVRVVGELAEVPRALPALRQQYVDAVEALAGKVPGMRQAGMSSEEIARVLHAERNALKVEYRALSPAERVAQFEARNVERYGNPLGPSIEQLRAAGKTWDDIIESATRPGGADLGF